MIKSFADKNTEKIWKGEVSKKHPREIQDDAREVMRFLNNIRQVEDLWEIPGLRAHKLVGNRQETWSLRVNKQWRLTFTWDANRSEALNVCLEDYH